MARAGATIMLGIACSRGWGQGINDYRLMGRYAAPSAGPYQESFDTAPDGRVVVASANDVFRETAPGSRRFDHLGALQGAGAPVLFPAFIRVSPDSGRIAVGNNSDAVGIFELPSLTGNWFFVGHYDAHWMDDRHLLIRSGGDVTVLDTQSPPNQPINPLILSNGPTPAGITLDAAGNLYTGNGFGGGGPSETGWVKAFSRDRWEAAWRGGPIIDFEAEGVLIVDLLSAAALGFDRTGNLHVGGGDFVGGSDVDFFGLTAADAVERALGGGAAADPNNPDEVRKADPDTARMDNFYDVAFEGKEGEILVRESSDSTIHVYGLPGGLSCSSIRKLKSRCGGEDRIRVRIKLNGRAPLPATLYTTIDGVPFRIEALTRKARHVSTGWAPGAHVLDLADPAGCRRGTAVTCP